MREIINEAMEWWQGGRTIALATVVATSDSAPRPAGATMLVGPDGQAFGSVSGGCVEGAVYDLAQHVTESRSPILERFGYSEESAFAVGLSCGGTLEVFVEAVDRASFPELAGVAADLVAGRPVAVATMIAHPDDTLVGRHLVIRPADSESAIEGALDPERLDAAVIEDVRGALAAGRTEVLAYGPDGTRSGDGVRIFVAAHRAPPRMLVFGAIDFAAAVCEVAAFLGYRVTVCDARATFATRARFPSADEVIIDWPHRYLAAEHAAGTIDARTVVCILTHDHKFDQPLLDTALRIADLAYIGAMGSRRTHAERIDGLRQAGFTDRDLARLASPIGLDLGARTPEETAISIVAEIIASQRGGTGRRLAKLDGPLHQPLGLPPRVR